MSKENPFTEHKEVVSRLKEPIKFKIIPYKTQKESGHQIQVEMNLSWEQIDSMKNKDGAIIQGISNCISLIENEMKSTYLGTVK